MTPDEIFAELAKGWDCRECKRHFRGGPDDEIPYAFYNYLGRDGAMHRDMICARCFRK
jgi:hypothetical protein